MRTTNRYADFLPQNMDIRRTKPLHDRTKIKPLTAGHTFPLFHLHKEDFVVPFPFLSGENSYIVGCELLNQPLVLAFYAVHWNDYGKRYLDELQHLYADIQVMGGQLLVVSADDRKELEFVMSESGYTFPLAIDHNYQIARSAGLYAESDPLWDRVSGIEENAPPPTAFVIGQSQHISYVFIDHYLDRTILVRELLTEVYNAGQASSSVDLTRAIA